MGKADPLAQLKDIHLPDPIGWWPLAPGWYVLVLIILALIIWVMSIGYKKRLHAKPKNQALELLATYKQQYEKEKNTQVTSARISELIRRVALVYFPREQVASLHGETWISFLNNTSKGIDFTPVQSMLLDSPFKPSETLDLNPLIVRTEEWVKQRRVPCSN